MPIAQKRCFGITLIGNSIVKVELTSQCGRVATRSDQTSSTLRRIRRHCRKPSQTEPRLLVICILNRKSYDASHLPMSPVSSNCRKGPSLSSAVAYRFAAVGAIIYMSLVGVSKSVGYTGIVERALQSATMLSSEVIGESRKKNTRHRASTSVYSLTFCVRVM